MRISFHLLKFTPFNQNDNLNKYEYQKNDANALKSAFFFSYFFSYFFEAGLLKKSKEANGSDLSLFSGFVYGLDSGFDGLFMPNGSNFKLDLLSSIFGIDYTF